MVIVMLLSLLVTAFTGLKALGSEGKGPLTDAGISIFRFAYADEDEDDHDDDDQKYKTGHHQKKQKEGFWEEIHESMTRFLIFLIIIHIGGVIISSWIHKENLDLAMINGRKKIL
jgi:cytochrome b